jgi:hypothetical protein
MEAALWHFANADGIAILGSLWRPFLVGLALYYSGYAPIWMRCLARLAGLVRAPAPLAPGEGCDILVVIPTLLGTRDELRDTQRAARTVMDNGYPGRLVLCLSIDGSDAAPGLVAELEAWAARTQRPGAWILVARSGPRCGKGVAVTAGLHRAMVAAERDEIPAMPPVFFNMDADGVLGPRALERMVAVLIRPGQWTRVRPMIVASNVLVRREHYWQGWRSFFTLRIQLALQVAREYTQSIGIGRNNRGLLPLTGVSGALYATWTELHLIQARHAAFMQSLRVRDLLAWWIGRAPPSLARFAGRPNVAVTAGPGDDTWMAWIAMAACWRGDRIDLELPRSPLHALARLLRAFVVRPIGYDARAHVYTATPTTVRGLWKQRVRWNSSRLWLFQRFGLLPAFAWSMGGPVALEMVMLLAMNVVVLVALIAWPVADRPAAWLSLFALSYLLNTAIRGGATLLAMIQDEDVRGQWHKLLALPLSATFHLVFNIATAITGLVQDVLLYGVHTTFAPETTLERSGTGRIAVAYRLRRAAMLALRAIRRGDVPLGWFWLGFHRTPWTPSGYAGWTVARASRRRRTRAGFSRGR